MLDMMHDTIIMINYLIRDGTDETAVLKYGWIWNKKFNSRISYWSIPIDSNSCYSQ